MRVTVVGCSPAWPNPGGAHSGYLVEAPGAGRLLLDCGPGVLARLRAAGGWPAIDAIALTHFHLDHWGDLVPWVWGSLYGGGAGIEPPELIVPPGGAERLRSLGRELDGAGDLFERAFRVREYDDDTAFAVAGFELRAVAVPHYGKPAYGIRVSGAGRVLAYSGDSGPSERLVELARDADLFLCEATLAAGEDGPRGHLSLDEARAAFAASGAGRLLITHRPVELPGDESVEFAFDGLTIDLV